MLTPQSKANTKPAASSLTDLCCTFSAKATFSSGSLTSRPAPPFQAISSLRYPQNLRPWIGVHPIKILTPQAYIDSILWLQLRDMGPDCWSRHALESRWSDIELPLRFNKLDYSHSENFAAAWAEMKQCHGYLYGPVMMTLRQELLTAASCPARRLFRPSQMMGFEDDQACGGRI
ncbi:hypothetical protein BJY01DRAFT_226838 [Aspergillus pseudoustus]|uniref:Uncharacterized protein n=1 Tax=Aspergillus pseudoustus TaxID=1810923 RepID=A0ABR4IT56_9EURO